MANKQQARDLDLSDRAQTRRYLPLQERIENQLPVNTAGKSHQQLKQDEAGASLPTARRMRALLRKKINVQRVNC
jgi:hypothetical protein